MIVTYLSSFICLALLYFLLSLLAKRNFRWGVVVLNLIFLSLSYFFISQLVGSVRPQYLHIPGFSWKHFTADNIVRIKTGWMDDNYVYVVIDEGSFNYTFYKIKNSPRLMMEIKKAIEEHNGFNDFDMKVDTKYPDGSEAHVSMGDAQKRVLLPKPSYRDEGVDTEVIK